MEKTDIGIMETDRQGLLDRSDFYLTLSRAFLPPKDEAIFAAFKDFLADDLADLDRSLGYGIDRRIAGLNAAMAGLGDRDALLLLYSSLFLSPPVPAPLNATVYLDGAVWGLNVVEMEKAYQAHGLERSGDFHDISDHLALQLEFIAHLFQTAAEGGHEAAHAAGDFLARFVAPWMGDFSHRIAVTVAEQDLAQPYLHLARLLGDAAARDAAQFAPPAEKVEAEPRRHTRAEAVIGDPETAAKCRICGTAFLREKQMAKMIRLLQEQGLGTDHLDTCPNCRTEAMGITPVEPPARGGKGRGRRA